MRTLHHTAAQPATGYRPGPALTPATVGGVIAIHAFLGAVLLTLPAAQRMVQDLPIMWVRFIPKADPPKPQVATNPAPHRTAAEQSRHREVIDPVIVPQTTTVIDPVDPPPSNGTGTGYTQTIDPKPPEPVLVDARVDARYRGDFQPDYPAAMVRRQIEGDVTVRVRIGTDGRVREVTLVTAPDPALFDATRAQALRAWRFVPATRGGVPVETEKLMTVHFRLTE